MTIEFSACTHTQNKYFGKTRNEAKMFLKQTPKQNFMSILDRIF